MTLLESHGLTEVINARGTFTPLGVSRSSTTVCAAVTEALSNYFIIDELQNLSGESIAKLARSEAATVTHCTASGITVSIAATMTGDSPEHIANLPDTKGLQDHVIISSNHCVNYGHSILQAIRLSGATPIVAGKGGHCSLETLEQHIVENNTCCLLLVSSKLVGSDTLDFTAAVKIAHKHGIPAIIDGAAQDFRISELIQTGADLVLISAQKYLAAPTAGLVVGQKSLVDAVRAQEKGIGRGMKASKESLLGVLAAIQERESLDIEEWEQEQQVKVSRFIDRVNAISGLRAEAVPDPTGLPFERVSLSLDASHSRCNAITLASKLKSGNPSIWVMDQNTAAGELSLELVQTSQAELDVILKRLEALIESINAS